MTRRAAPALAAALALACGGLRAHDTWFEPGPANPKGEHYALQWRFFIGPAERFILIR